MYQFYSLATKKRLIKKPVSLINKLTDRGWKLIALNYQLSRSPHIIWVSERGSQYNITSHDQIQCFRSLSWGHVVLQWCPAAVSVHCSVRCNCCSQTHSSLFTGLQLQNSCQSVLLALISLHPAAGVTPHLSELMSPFVTFLQRLILCVCGGAEIYHTFSKNISWQHGI